MTVKHLIESASLVSESANADGTWKVRLISEGRGSSGVYSAELLEKYHSVFDDVLSFEMHPEWSPEFRTFHQIVGRIVGETWIERDESDAVGIYGNYLPDDAFREKLERYKDKLGLSIFIAGEGVETDKGELIVESFDGDDPYRSVDVVIAAGRGGRFEESLRKIYADRVQEGATGNKPGTEASVQETRKKDKHMTPEEIAQLIESVKAAVVESLKPIAEAEAHKDEHELTIEEALSAYAEKVKSIDEADLLPSQAESLKAKAAKGEDIADSLEEAKKIRDEARQSVQTESFNQPRGRVLGESAPGYAGPTAWGHKH